MSGCLVGSFAVNTDVTRFVARAGVRARMNRFGNRQQHSVLVSMSVAVTVAAVLGMWSAKADAGAYKIGDCPSAANSAQVAGPWQYVGPSAGVIVKATCAGRVGESLYFAAAQLPAGTLAFQASTEGTGLTILGARLYWRAFGSPSGAVEAEMVATNAAGEDLAISSGAGSGELIADMSSPEEVVLPASDEATTIQLAERCFEGDVCPMSESFGVGVQIFGAELTLEDPTPPVATVTGVEDEGGGFDGSVLVAFTAADQDSGVKRAELLVDGAAVATDDYSSSCSYTRLQPCPGSISDHLKSPPISFLEAGHELAVRVTDGAENTTVVPVPRIANGAPCPAPQIALRADGHQGGVTVPFGRGAVVEGRLGCGATPIPGANVSVSSEVIGDGPAVAAATLQTGPDGSFRYVVPAGPGRKLNFSYRAYSDEPTSTVGASIQVDVKPRIRFYIFPDRVPYNGTIKWRAAVEGGPYPPDGVELRLQYKVGKHWHTFTDVLVSDGLLAYKYKFKRTHTPTTYRFRVALPRTGAVGYPYTGAESHEFRVHVGPGGRHSGASRGGKRRRSASRARASGRSSGAGVLCGGVSARVWPAGCG